MERESFEDENIGSFLNEHFVSIKVDREERPDVDKIYMTFVQSTTGSGGWPLNVFLTPDLKPFFGGTYFPPDARYGRPVFCNCSSKSPMLWQERKSEIAASADEIHARLEDAMADRRRSQSLLERGRFEKRGGIFQKNVRPATTAALAARRNFRSRAFRRFCCAARNDSATTKPRKWFCTPATRWRRAESTTSSAADLRATRWTPNGSCRISRKCSTTTRSSRSFISTRFSSAATRDHADTRPRHFGLCFARHDASRRRIFFRRRRRQRRPRGKILLLDEGRTFQIADRRMNSMSPRNILASRQKEILLTTAIRSRWPGKMF